MKDDGRRLPSLDALGEQLGRAARRRPDPAPHGRRFRRVFTIAAVASVGTASAAAAGVLLGVGQPVTSERDQPAGLRPEVRGRLDVTSADPRSRVVWGVRSYRSRDGSRCAVAGRVVNGLVGQLRADGRFAPFAEDTVGACTDVQSERIAFGVVAPSGPLRRTLVFGRAGESTVAIRLRTPSSARTLSLGRDGAFLAVFEGIVRLADISVVAQKSP